MDDAHDDLHGFYERNQPTRFGAHRAQVQIELFVGALAERPDALVVDLGCGDGQLTALARAAVPGATVIGLDWSAAALASTAASGIPAVRGGVDGVDLPFPDESVDVVMMNEVIEHLVEVDHAVAEARRILRPGGHLLVSTPNLAAWFNRILLAAGVQPVFSEVSRKGIFGRPGTEVVGHLRLYTRRALHEFLTAHGFADVEIRGAAYHDVPLPARPLDRVLARWPGMAAILVARTVKPR